jgi:HD superfamily phosphohydrolase
MPKWGLTAEQRRLRPWGLDEMLLEADKVITDPIHGDIYLTRLERLVVDSPPLQRLRRVRQLGTTHLVYPGATHSRFSHVLGALRAAQDLLDAVVDQRHGPSPADDLFGEWEADPEEYELRVAEATVLARMGALLHDLCHVSFGHTIEDDLGILEAHDRNSARFDTLWSRFPEELRDALPADFVAALRPLILSKEKVTGPVPVSRYPFVADIVGNTICADLLDYLPRDHYYTGLPAKLGHRFVAGFYVTRTDHPYFSQRMAIRIMRRGRERDDAVSELFKYLRYRYELSERVLVHHAKLAADAMVGKSLEMWHDAIWLEEATRKCPEILKKPVSDIDEARKLVEQSDPQKLNGIDAAVSERVETEVLRRGDEGLLEHLLDFAEKQARQNKRLFGVQSLTTGLLYRRLFKLTGRCRSARSNAGQIYEAHGSPASRRRLEQDAGKYAGLDHDWKVLVWIPAPEMRLKAAEVLVDDGNKVCRLVDLDSAGPNRGREIYDSHKALWAISVFVHPSVSAEQRAVVLARLGDKLGGIRWDNLQEQPSISRLAAANVGRARKLSRHDEDVLAQEAEGIAARRGGKTYQDLVRQVSQVADARFPKSGKIS